MLENKFQIIHIAVETTAFIGLGFYFSQKNKKMQCDIDNLTQRLKEQEDIIQKHEQMIIKLVNMVDEHIISQSTKQISPKLKSKNSRIYTIPSINIQKTYTPKHVSFNSTVEEIKDEEIKDEETDEELDNELLEELKELEN